MPGVDPATLSLALDSAALLHSDGDRSRAIQELLDLSAAPQAALLPQLARVNPAGDKARVLTRAAELFIDEAAIRDPSFVALNSIHASGDRQRVLLALLARPVLTPESFEAINPSAAQIPDHGDRRRVRDSIAARR